MGWAELMDFMSTEQGQRLLTDHSKQRLRALLAGEPSIAAEPARPPSAPRVRRLRATRSALGHRVEEEDGAEPMQRIRQRLDAFMELLLAYDKALIHRDCKTKATLEDVIPNAFSSLSAGLDALLGDASSLGEQQRDEIGHVVQREMMPLLLQTEVARRMYAKPRGHAGDFHTIEMIYERRAGGVGELGPLLDACFLAEPAIRAVRNRRRLLARQIELELLTAHAESRMARITGLACGSAREIQDVQERSPLAGHLGATLVDVDAKALAHVARRQLSLRPPGCVRLVKDNPLHLAMSRSDLYVAPQDLVYSVGLIDELSDDLVITLLDWLHGLLRPGGRVILGSFHPANPTKALMDHVLEWRPHHRSEDDMHRLFEASRFGSPCSRILFEEQGIHLFAEGVRQG